MTNTHNQMPTIRTAGAALLRADDTSHSAMQAGACAVMLGVEENTIMLPDGLDWKQTAALVLKDGQSNEAKAFLKAVRESVETAFSDHKEKGGNQDDRSANFSRQLAKIKSKMAEAARSACALVVIGATPQCYKPRHANGTGGKVFWINRAAMLPRDKHGNIIRNATTNRQGDSFPLDNGVTVYSDGEQFHKVELTLKAIKREADAIVGRQRQTRNAKERAEDTTAELAKSPVGVASMLHAARDLVSVSGHPSKALREDATVNSEAAALMIRLMMAFGIMTLHQDGDGVPSIITKRALEVYQATVEGNPVDVIKH